MRHGSYPPVPSYPERLTGGPGFIHPIALDLFESGTALHSYIQDDAVIPVDMTMGEIRKALKALNP